MKASTLDTTEDISGYPIKNKFSRSNLLTSYIIVKHIKQALVNYRVKIEWLFQ